VRDEGVGGVNQGMKEFTAHNDSRGPHHHHTTPTHTHTRAADGQRGKEKQEGGSEGERVDKGEKMGKVGRWALSGMEWIEKGVANKGRRDNRTTSDTQADRSIAHHHPPFHRLVLRSSLINTSSTTLLL
jgi:hypothetical protein